MPIYSLLQKLPMGPDEIRCLTTAYEQTLTTLCLKDRNDPLTEMIAKKIIKIAQTGVKDPGADFRACDQGTSSSVRPLQSRDMEHGEQSSLV